MISLAEKVNEAVEINTTHVDESVNTANKASQQATKALEDVRKAITEANTTLQEANVAKVSAQASATASAGSASAAAGSASAASGSAADAAASAKAAEDIAEGLGRFDGTAISIKATDTQGIVVAAGADSNAQALLDALAHKVAQELVSNTALATKLADYVAKTDIVQVESTATNKVPSSAYLKSVKDDINSNLSVRYDADTDCLQALYNDNWTSVFLAGLNPTRTWIFMSSLGLQSGALAKPLNSLYTNNITKDMIYAPLCKSNRTTSIFISNFDFITAANNGKKLVIEWSVTNADAFSNIYVAIAKGDGANNNTNFYKSTSPITANARNIIEVSLSSAIGFSATYPNIQIQYSNTGDVTGTFKIHNIYLTA